LHALVYPFRFSLLVIFSLIYFSSNAQKARFSFSEQKMGSPLNIIFYAQDSLIANKQARACFKLVDSLNHIFSNYDSSSELTRINNNAGIAKNTASPLMWELLMKSKEAYIESNGAYNIAMGPLTQLWRIARRSKKFPTQLQIKKTLLLCDFNKIQLNELEHSIYLSAKGMQIDFGGIGKGYIAQKVVDFLNTQGIPESLVDAGGDIVLGNAPWDKKGWTVGVNQPEKADDLLPEKLQLHNLSVATSGDVYQFIENNGKKYSHIIDPATGYGVTSLRNVTVIANDGALADWLATACSILSIHQAKKLANTMHAELLITELINNRIQPYSTKGFAQYWKAPLIQENE
jgi:thiamine biosynthesis lipoprotein